MNEVQGITHEEPIENEDGSMTIKAVYFVHDGELIGPFTMHVSGGENDWKKQRD